MAEFRELGRRWGEKEGGGKQEEEEEEEEEDFSFQFGNETKTEGEGGHCCYKISSCTNKPLNEQRAEIKREERMEAGEGIVGRGGGIHNSGRIVIAGHPEPSQSMGSTEANNNIVDSRVDLLEYGAL